MNNNEVANAYLSELKKEQAMVDIFLLNGTCMHGFITHYDDETILLDKEPLIYKHSISTVQRQKVNGNKKNG